MSNYADLVSDNNIPQTERLNERQIANHGGGFGFQITPLQRLRRFLILGSDSGTYYQNAREITRENAKIVSDLWNSDPDTVFEVAKIIRDVSFGGLAPKNDAAIFAVTIGTMAKEDYARKAAYELIPVVCRTGTHLFQLVAGAKKMGKGFGRGFKRAIANWYLRAPDQIAYQMVKYRSREKLTHENILDMARPKPASKAHDALFAWAVGKEYEIWELPMIVQHHLLAIAAEKPAQLKDILRENSSLPWEALPTWANNDPEIQELLLPNMGLTALLRNLGRLTALGVIKPLSKAEEIVAQKFGNKEVLRKARLHPINILLALKVYESGKGVRSSGAGWEPVPAIRAVLDQAFYDAMDLLEPTGKRYMIGVDVSDSMTWPSSMINGVLQSRICASAMAMAISKTERAYIMAFSNGVVPVDVHNGMSISEVTSRFARLPASSTDCSAPMRHALQRGIEVDCFVVLTDNETNFSTMHPSVALKQYRERTGIPAKLAVLGMTATNVSVADPTDAGMMDFVGFDSSVPSLLKEFASA